MTKTDNEWLAALDAALAASRRNDLRHGTNAAYIAGCVCKECRASADPHGEESLNTNSTYDGFSAREFGTLRFLITSPSRFDRTVNLGGFWMRTRALLGRASSMFRTPPGD
jgi:hypothetical protein